MANPFCIGSKGKSQVYSLFCIAFVISLICIGGTVAVSANNQQSQVSYDPHYELMNEKPGLSDGVMEVYSAQGNLKYKVSSRDGATTSTENQTVYYPVER